MDILVPSAVVWPETLTELTAVATALAGDMAAVRSAIDAALRADRRPLHPRSDAAGITSDSPASLAALTPGLVDKVVTAVRDALPAVEPVWGGEVRDLAGAVRSVWRAPSYPGGIPSPGGHPSDPTSSGGGTTLFRPLLQNGSCTDWYHFDTLRGAARSIFDNVRDLVPRDYDGRDYPQAIRLTLGGGRTYVECGSLAEGRLAEYRVSDPGRLWFDPSFFSSGFLDQTLGQVTIRAGVLLHELVHLIDAEIFDIFREGRVFVTREGDEVVLAGAETEFTATYLQGRFYGLNQCISEEMAASYLRLIADEDDVEESTPLGRAWSFLTRVYERCYLVSPPVAVVATILAAALVGPVGVTAVLGALAAPLILFLFDYGF